ncbi:MAG: hypothetical protein AB7S57_08545 [Acetobacteraceae bacterium]
MPYLPPYERFKEKLTITNFRGVPTATAPVDDIKGLIRALLCHVPVDETWYLAQYQDVAAAVQKGVFASGSAHFMAEGYFEGRKPFPIAVNEEWYLHEYPEVAAAIDAGTLGSAQQHFEENGYREGRLPGPVDAGG